MDKIWLDSYPDGVPHTINVDAHRSLVDIFEHSFDTFFNKPAFECFGSALTYSELNRDSRDFAAYLQSVLGLAKGSRVALMLPNIFAYPVCLLGALRAGMTVVNVNPLYTKDELVHQLQDAEVDVLVTFEYVAHVVAQAHAQIPVKSILIAELGDFIRWPKSWVINMVARYRKRPKPYELQHAFELKAAMRMGADAIFTRVQLKPDDLAFLQYTGGTTGLAKGAMLTHKNMMANLAQTKAWVAPFLTEGEERVITALPMYHIFSLLGNCLLFMTLGGCNILVPNPRDHDAFIKVLQQTRFTAITGVNTLFNMLMAAPGFTDIDFSSLKMSLGGGMAVQKSVAEQWQHLTRSVLLPGYGLTEASPAVSINPLNAESFNETIGLPLPSTDVRIVDERGHDVELGEVGELCVSGPQVMAGYWQQPQETAQVFLQEKWLRTGDMVRMNANGYLRIVDRKKDLIIVSGFNVYPNEIEDVIAAHSGVLEVGVIGVPSDATGESVIACIVKKDPNLTEQAILNHCRQHLTGYKRPEQVIFKEALPKTNVGKILRRTLRDNITAQLNENL